MDTLVLIDLDLTLINREYNLTLPLDQVCAAISEAKKNGVMIGLNSDSSHHTLIDWYKKLGLDGPIILERGAVIFRPGLMGYIDISSDSARLFSQLRQDFVEILPSICPNILCGDANVIQATYRPWLGEEKFIIINDYRQRSLSFFARQLGKDGKLLIDSVLLNQAAALLNSLIQDKYPTLAQEKDEDNNPDYGVYILHSLFSKKHRAVVKLLDELKLDQIWMIGDSLSDFIDDVRVKHVAVSNARDSFKEKANFITKGAITEGVIEFLQTLSEATDLTQALSRIDGDLQILS
ncbi:MAG: HAD hydrolase family protein [Patescibacteria group bacterium]